MIDPYEQGYEDALLGFELCDNPYEFGTDAHGMWKQGMLDADADYGE